MCSKLYIWGLSTCRTVYTENSQSGFIAWDIFELKIRIYDVCVETIDK